MMLKPYTWIEINSKALQHNLKELKAVVGNGVLAPVIKANAYGHGLLQVGRVCQESEHVDWVCVAALSEALALRKSGFTKPILVMVYTDENPALAIEHDISLMVYNKQALKELAEQAQKEKRICNVHIKADTGLSRLGSSPEKTIQFVELAQSLPGINVQGIGTHFAQSQAQDQSFTQKQLTTFKTILQQLKEKNIQIPLRHACNSAATLRLNAKAGNFFRPGIAVYGYWASPHVQKEASDISLKPVLTWKTKIFNTKTVPAGRSIGYDRTYETKKKTRLGYLPIGYAQGYKRSLANKAYVIVNQKPAAIIGQIGMNVITIDITDIPEAKTGTEVTLIGNASGTRASDLAQLIDGNVRELTTRICPTIPRSLC